LKGHDLNPSDPNGLADPYIVFCGPFLAEEQKTNVEFKTLNPVWKDSIKLNCKPVSTTYLEKQHIVLQVVDKDLLVADDPMGQGVISLKDAFYKPKSFTANITLFGKRCGTISGKVVIAKNLASSK